MYGTIVIEEIQHFADSREDISAMVLTGSWARGDATERSDIDIFLITETDPEIVLHDMAVTMAPDVKETVRSKTDKWIFFFGEGYLKADISVVSDVDTIEKMYRGSRITDTLHSVRIDRDGTVHTAVSAWVHTTKIPDLTPEIAKVTEGFMEMFELASRYVVQNDAYRFYFAYNIALARYSTLLQLQKGNDAYLYAPRSLLEDMNNKKQKDFRSLAGSLDLRDAERLLERLSAAFVREYRAIHSRQSCLPREPDEILLFLTTIRRRDLTYQKNRILPDE